MKYSEFKRIMEDEGFLVEKLDFETNVRIYASNDLEVAIVDKQYEGAIDLQWSEFFKLPIEKRKFIADKCMELAFTPIEDREEEEKFKLKQRGISGKYLIWIPEMDRFTTGSSPFSNVEGVFTQSEIDEMPECYTHPAVWEKVRVESGY